MVQESRDGAMITIIEGENHKEVETLDEFKAKFWEIDGFDDEVLIHDDPEDAIQDYFDDLSDYDLSEIPDELVVVGYAPMKITEIMIGDPLNRILEDLDSEYGDPNGNHMEPSERLLALEREFVKAIIEEYVPWACERTGEKVVINMREWVLKNHPEYFEKCFGPKNTGPVMHVQ